MIARALEDGDTLLRNNKLDEAQAKYEAVLEQREDAKALSGLGRVELARENPAGAIEPLQKSIALKADDPLAQASLGRALAGTKDWASAAEHLGKAWELTQKDEDQYGLEFGVAQRENKQYEQAITTLEEVADNNPKIKYVYRELAHTHKAAGDLDKALRTYMKAQSAWMGDQDSYAGAAMVYEEQGEIPKSVDQWAKYIQQDCCSTYSKEVAQPKLAELKAKENAGDTPPAEPPAEAPTEG